MPVSRLILIEGMVGAGKSATAAAVARRLVAQGDDALAYDEFADDHPIRTRAVDLLRAASPEVAASPSVPTWPSAADEAAPARDAGVYALDQWRVLAERCRRERRTTILESTFLQNSVLPSFISGAPIEQVQGKFSRIEGLIAPVRPLLVYLRPSDIEAAVRRVHRDRGEPWSSWNVASVSASPWAQAQGLCGPEAVVGFDRAWEPVVDELLGLYSSPKLLLVDPQADWEGTVARIAAAARA
jgi:hypothetical protein